EESLIANNQGKDLFNAGRVLEAAQKFKLASDMDRKNVEPLNNLGVCFHQQNMKEQAGNCFKLALACDNGNRTALLNLLESDLHQDEKKKHIHSYLKICPNDTEVKGMLDFPG
ncbi:MAG: hypothetical protein ABIA63_12850, partial [bacterium]